MNAWAAEAPVSATVVAVVVFCLIASGLCLVFALVCALRDRAADAVKDAAKRASKRTTARPTTLEQSGQVDFAGLSKLADALEKLNLSGRLLVVGLGFAAIAAVAAGTDSIASAVS